MDEQEIKKLYDFMSENKHNHFKEYNEKIVKVKVNLK